jgi:hypothetical protein
MNRMGVGRRSKFFSEKVIGLVQENKQARKEKIKDHGVSGSFEENLERRNPESRDGRILFIGMSTAQNSGSIHPLPHTPSWRSA